MIFGVRSLRLRLHNCCAVSVLCPLFPVTLPLQVNSQIKPDSYITYYLLLDLVQEVYTTPPPWAEAISARRIARFASSTL